jgi:hypothetical protein
MLVRTKSRPPDRRGAAAVELAVVLPFLLFLIGVGTDFARIFYASQILSNCARNGAIYESDEYFRQDSPYGPFNVVEAALADAPNLMADPANKPKVTSTVTPDTPTAGQSTVTVTVEYKFKTIARFIGIPNEVTLSRSVTMVTTPKNPGT